MNSNLNVLWNTEFLSLTYTPSYPCTNNGPVSEPLDKLIKELNQIIESLKGLTNTFLVHLLIYIILYVKQKYGMTYNEIFTFIESVNSNVTNYPNFKKHLKNALRFGSQKGIFLLHYLLTLNDGSTVVITPENYNQYKLLLKKKSANVQFLYCVNTYMQFSDPRNEKFLPCMCDLYHS